MVAGRQVLLLKKITHLSSLAEIMMNHLCAVKSGGESKAGIHVLHITWPVGLYCGVRILGGILSARRVEGLGVGHCRGAQHRGQDAKASRCAGAV